MLITASATGCIFTHSVGFNFNRCKDLTKRKKEIKMNIPARVTVHEPRKYTLLG